MTSAIECTDAADWDAIYRVASHAFHEDAGEASSAAEAAIFEPDAVLVARRDGEIVGTAGISPASCPSRADGARRARHARLGRRHRPPAGHSHPVHAAASSTTSGPPASRSPRCGPPRGASTSASGTDWRPPSSALTVETREVRHCWPRRPAVGCATARPTSCATRWRSCTTRRTRPPRLVGAGRPALGLPALPISRAWRGAGPRCGPWCTRTTDGLDGYALWRVAGRGTTPARPARYGWSNWWPHPGGLRGTVAFPALDRPDPHA